MSRVLLLRLEAWECGSEGMGGAGISTAVPRVRSGGVVSCVNGACWLRNHTR